MRAAKAAGRPVELLAINHWQIAVETHTANHPLARHMCEDIESVKPREAIPGGRINLLLASPECIHHSNARGGRPMNDQSRASAWHILRWAEALYIDSIIIENVPEFQSWGALGANGRPLKKKKGELFQQFLRSLRALGYVVDYRVLNAADYGDATTRQRLFIQARRGGRKIRWPEPSHGKVTATTQTVTLFPELKTERWRPAREIIDWTIPGRSIYGRKKPLADNTLRRIFAGLKRFSGLPFILPHQHGTSGARNVRGLDEPLPTVTGTSADIFLAEPFLVVLRNNGAGRSLDEPCPAVLAGANHIGLAEPCLVNLKGQSIGRSVDEPSPTITAHASHLYLAEPAFIVGAGGPVHAGQPHTVDDPLGAVLTRSHRCLVQPEFVIGQQSGAAPRSVGDPLPTVAGAGAISVIEPCIIATDQTGSNGCCAYSAGAPLPVVTTKNLLGVVSAALIPTNHGPEARSHDLDLPMPTVTAFDAMGLGEGCIVPYYGERDGQEPRSGSLDDPLDTVTCQSRQGFARPFLLKFNGTGGPRDVEDPLDTISTRDRFALVHPELVRSGEVQGEVVGWLDIRFRMLQPAELAAAMSFPSTYSFAGNREQKVRQIGNAVPVRLAEALCREMLA